MENIKITYIPHTLVKSNKGLLKSIIEISLYDTDLINTHIFYNTELDISVNENNSTLFEYIDYINQENLYSTISKTLMSEGYETVIFLYGYDLTLDDIKNNICPLVHDCEGVFISINIIKNEDESNFYNMNTYLDSKCYDIEDEEWNKIKEDLNKAYKGNKLKEIENDTSSSSLIGIDNLYDLTDKLSILYDLDSKITSGDIISTSSKDNFDKVDEKEICKDFVCYSYEDFYNCLSINKDKDLITIEDEDGNKILFNLKALGFVIDTLNKFHKSN